MSRPTKYFDSSIEQQMANRFSRVDIKRMPKNKGAEPKHRYSARYEGDPGPPLYVRNATTAEQAVTELAARHDRKQGDVYVYRDDEPVPYGPYEI